MPDIVAVFEIVNSKAPSLILVTVAYFLWRIDRRVLALEAGMSMIRKALGQP